MRKFLVVFAALMLILAFTAVDSMAKAKISFKGDIRYRGWTLDNMDRDRDSNDSQQTMDTRGRFKMTAKTSDDLTGVFYFEIGDAFIGQNSNVSGEPGFANDTDQQIVEVKQMYIDFKLPWNKAFQFQIGAVPAYDLPKGILFGADAAGIKGKYEFKNGKIIAWYYKDKESEVEAADRDYMGGIGFYNITKDIRVGAHVSYTNDRFDKRDTGYDGTTPDSGGGTSDHIWWYGFTANGKLPTAHPVKFTADVILMDGERDYDDGVAQTLQDYEGMAADVTAGTNIGPVYVEGFFSYASGDDNDSDYDSEMWRNVETGKGNFRRMMLVHGYSGFDGGDYSDMNGDFLLTGKGNSYNGLVMVGAKAVYKPTSKLKLTGQFANINSAEDANKLDSDLGANTDIGNELDIIVDYKLYKKLNLRGIVAYMWAGDYFKQSGLGTDVGTDDPWFLGYNFTYKF